MTTIGCRRTTATGYRWAPIRRRPQVMGAAEMSVAQPRGNEDGDEQTLDEGGQGTDRNVNAAARIQA